MFDAAELSSSSSSSAGAEVLGLADPEELAPADLVVLVEPVATVLPMSVVVSSGFTPTQLSSLLGWTVKVPDCAI